MPKIENTPVLETERLILRRFTPADGEAVYRLYSDKEVNRFLPWFPLESREEAEKCLREFYLESYEKPCGYRYAVCLRAEDAPIGYVHVSGGESRDLGYALRREHWGQGIAAEAGRAVLARLREAGYPYVTATHDILNPASGAVMRKMGMTYRYSYREQWQPKDIPVTFRMYQINLDGQEDRVYKQYWEQYPVHFVEDLAGEFPPSAGDGSR